MLIERIRMLLGAATGLELDRRGVSKAIRTRMRVRGEYALAAYVQQVHAGSAELNALVDEIVVPETWFFREPEAFAAACAIVDSKRRRSEPVRILSLPCASGEEPYSMAIALAERGVPEDAYSIDAMDVSAQALARARAGVYSRNAFRGENLAFRSRWFAKRGDAWHLHRAVREKVRFTRANLLELGVLAPLARYDIVFCRNLLIYFDNATQVRAIRQLEQLLQPDGVLFSGYAEAPAFCRAGFTQAPYPRAFALVRRASAAHAPTLEARASAAVRPSSAPLSRSISRSTAAATTMAVPALSTVARSTAAPADAKSSHGDLLQRAQRLADDGELEQAASLYRRYLADVPESADAHFMLGVLSERMNDLGAAADCLRRAVYLDPAHYEALCHLALLQERQGEHALARGLRARAARVFRRHHESESRR